MKYILSIAVSIALLCSMAPEFIRYRGEYRLYFATALFRSRLSKPAPDREAIFNAVAASAAEAAADLPGDSRPLILQGSLRLLAREPAEAVVFYRLGLATSERAEIDLNLGRAYEMLGDHRGATAALLRAAWISPAIVSSLPENVQAPLRTAIARDEELLRTHRLPEAPQLILDSPK